MQQPQGADQPAPRTPPSGVRARTGLAAALLVAGLAAGCSDERTLAADDRATTPPPSVSARTAPELEPAWSLPGLNANPHTAGQHHWLTHQVTRSGVGWGTTSYAGPLLLVDTRTGTSHTHDLRGRAPCLLPRTISPSGVTPVLSASYVAQPYVAGGSRHTEPCARATVLDATTGRVLWKADALDLTGLGAERAMGATDELVVVTDEVGRHRCWSAREGTPVDDREKACRALADRLTYADLPTLLGPDGEPVPLQFTDPSSNHPREVGRTDEVLLVEDTDELGETYVRAHDLATGETLWTDDLARDPHRSGPWVRDERWAVVGQALLHVTYDHPRTERTVASTPMVLTLTDARTGTHLRTLGTVAGGWFNRQFGTVTVALTQQERGFGSTISGFELPPW